MTFDRLESFGAVFSTMDIARERALQGDAAGRVILAEFQKSGRGRQGRAWFAPPGANVMLTAIGEPVAAGEAWKVALLTAVAAVEGIALATGVKPALRFPNDLWLREKKLGGILIETVPHSEPESEPGAVTPLIGIGVNVNVAEEDFPPELRDSATSLLRTTGREYLVGPIAGFILQRLGELWDGLVGDFDTILLTRWRTYADGTTRRTFHWDGAQRICRVIDISADGTVYLETDLGKRRSLHAAQVILGDD